VHSRGIRVHSRGIRVHSRGIPHPLGQLRHASNDHHRAGRDEADASVTWSPTICTRAENGVDANLTQGFANYPHARAEKRPGRGRPGLKEMVALP